MTGWFTQPRYDLAGASTQDIIARALDCLMGVGAASPGDALAASMRGHAIDGARFALDDLVTDPPFGVVVRAVGLDPAGLLRAFDAGRFDAVRADLNQIIAVGLVADLPAGEALAREAIDAQAAFYTDLDREFPSAPLERAEHG